MKPPTDPPQEVAVAASGDEATGSYLCPRACGTIKRAPGSQLVSVKTAHGSPWDDRLRGLVKVLAKEADLKAEDFV